MYKGLLKRSRSSLDTPQPPPGQFFPDYQKLDLQFQDHVPKPSYFTAKYALPEFSTGSTGFSGFTRFTGNDAQPAAQNLPSTRAGDQDDGSTRTPSNDNDKDI